MLEVDPNDKKAVNVNVGGSRSFSFYTVVIVILWTLASGFLGYVIRGIQTQKYVIKEQIAVKEAREALEKRSKALNEIEGIRDRVDPKDGLITIEEGRSLADQAVARAKALFERKKPETIVERVIPDGYITWGKCQDLTRTTTSEAVQDLDSINEYRRKLGLPELKG